jgi:hypothetical protein
VFNIEGINSEDVKGKYCAMLVGESKSQACTRPLRKAIFEDRCAGNMSNDKSEDGNDSDPSDPEVDLKTIPGAGPALEEDPEFEEPI